MEVLIVNRKQFHFLVIKFLMEHRLLDRWFKDSRAGTNRREYDDFSDYLYSCIDIYTSKEKLYSGCIYGFFRFIPATGLHNAWRFWDKYSNLWENKYKLTKYEKNIS